MAGVILAVLGALAGYLVARRLLGPLRRASKAAGLMSKGDLDIRLPAGQDEFGVLSASFNRMAENLQAKMQDLEAGQARERRFVADVAHELRTPVSALVGEASLLRVRTQSESSGCPPDVNHLAGMVSTDIGRLRQLVDDLLEISRLDARSADTFIETVYLEDLLTRLVGAYGWSSQVGIESEDGGGHSSRPISDVWSASSSTSSTTPCITEPRRCSSGSAPKRAGRVRRAWWRYPWRTRVRAYRRSTCLTSSTASTRPIPAAPPAVAAGWAWRSRARTPVCLGGDLTAANLPEGGARFVLTLPDPTL